MTTEQIEGSYNEGFRAASSGEARDVAYEPAAERFAYDAGFHDGSLPMRMPRDVREAAIRALVSGQS